jgi:hypothetical protein
MQNKLLVCKIQTVPKTIRYTHLPVSWTDSPRALLLCWWWWCGLSVVGRLLLLFVLLY